MKLFYWVFSKILHKRAKKAIQECQSSIQKGAKILDIGCGAGITGKALSDSFGAKVLGVDIVDNRIVDIPFKIIDGENLPFKENEFDVCFISYVLHHAKNPLALFKEAKRVSRDKIIIYEDIPRGILSKLRCYLHQIIYSVGVPTRKFNFKTQEEWEALFKDSELKIVAKKKVCSECDWISPIKRVLYVLEKTGA